MNKLTIAGIAVFLLFIILAALSNVQRKVEDQIFGLISANPVIVVDFSSKTGNLMSGYTLNDVTITRMIPETGNVDSKFETPSLALGWKVPPVILDSIKWEAGSFTVNSGTAYETTIPIGPGELTPSSNSTALSGSGIKIADDSWSGILSVSINNDGSCFSGSSEFQNLPPEELGLLAFNLPVVTLPESCKLTVEFDGEPGTFNASGSLTFESDTHNTDPGSINTPLINMAFDLDPFTVTVVSWDTGTWDTTHPDGTPELIAFKAGQLIPLNDALSLENKLIIGPDEWQGWMTLTLASDLGSFDSRIYFNRLPATMLDVFTSVPDDFIMHDYVSVSIVAMSTVDGVTLNGTVANPDTRETFIF